MLTGKDFIYLFIMCSILTYSEYRAILQLSGSQKWKGEGISVIYLLIRCIVYRFLQFTITIFIDSYQSYL